MSASYPNKQKRDCSLPPGCKDLIDAIMSQPEPVPVSLPPVTRHVTLPDIVAVRYLAELLQMSTHEAEAVSGYAGGRSIPFEQAQRILRRYGIWARKKSSLSLWLAIGVGLGVTVGAGMGMATRQMSIGIGVGLAIGLGVGAFGAAFRGKSS
jgi:hypothetical protein